MNSEERPTLAVGVVLLRAKAEVSKVLESRCQRPKHPHAGKVVELRAAHLKTVSHQKGISGIKDKAGFESSNRAALSTGKMSAGCEKNFAMGSRFDRSGGLLFGDCIEAEGKPTTEGFGVLSVPEFDAIVVGRGAPEVRLGIASTEGASGRFQ
jgi:hypothetical protein